MSCASTRRSGFTLLEMLAVMAGLGVCMFVGTTLIVTMMRAERSGESAGNRLAQRQELARIFRDDVSRAETAPEKLDDFKAGPACLILRTSDGKAVVYHWEKNTLNRFELFDKKRTQRVVPLGSDETQVEFVAPSGKSGVLTLRTIEANGKGAAKRSELRASLGGNLR